MFRFLFFLFFLSSGVSAQAQTIACYEHRESYIQALNGAMEVVRAAARHSQELATVTGQIENAFPNLFFRCDGEAAGSTSVGASLITVRINPKYLAENEAADGSAFPDEKSYRLIFPIVHELVHAANFSNGKLEVERDTLEVECETDDVASKILLAAFRDPALLAKVKDRSSYRAKRFGYWNRCSANFGFLSQLNELGLLTRD